MALEVDMDSMTAGSEAGQAAVYRQRARMACEPCRERKKKCAGGHPCPECLGFGFTCMYRDRPRMPRRAKHPTRAVTARTTTTRAQTAQATPPASASQDNGPSEPVASNTTSLQSNSGLAFVKNFAKTVNGSGSSLIGTPAWNLFLGCRGSMDPGRAESLTSLLSREDALCLAEVFFEKVDPCWGFVEQSRTFANIEQRWMADGARTLFDATIAALAAVACLFSPLKDRSTECMLIALAKKILNDHSHERPSFDSATAHTLHTAYLRLAGTPEAAWLSSCIAMHHIDGASLHYGSDPVNTSQPIELARRLIGVARHLNIWLSFDLARARVILPIPSFPVAEQRSEHYTSEIIGLLPFTEELDPSNLKTANDLLGATLQILDSVHTQPPSVLAQCNLALCLYRRLYTLRVDVSSATTLRLVQLIGKGTEAVDWCLQNQCPWHQVANVPFQSICALLAMSTVESFSVLKKTMSSLERVSAVYPTQATRDAVLAARTLVHMDQKRREVEVREQNEILMLYPDYATTEDNMDVQWLPDQLPDDSITLDDFLRQFDVADWGLVFS